MGLTKGNNSTTRFRSLVFICSMLLVSNIGQVYSQGPLSGESVLQSLDIPPKVYTLQQLLVRACDSDSFDRGLVSEWQLQRWCWLNGMSVDACEQLFKTKVCQKISIPCPEWWAANLMMAWRDFDGQTTRPHDKTSSFGPISYRKLANLALEPNVDHYIGMEGERSCVLSMKTQPLGREMSLRFKQVGMPSNEIDLVKIAPVLGPAKEVNLFAEIILDGDRCTIFAQDYMFWFVQIDLKTKAPKVLFFNQAAMNDVSLSKTFDEFRFHVKQRSPLNTNEVKVVEPTPVERK